MCVFLIHNNTNNFSMIWLQNSAPLSDTYSRGSLCLHSHLENKAEATGMALLSGMANSLAYFENASVSKTICIFFPKKSSSKDQKIHLDPLIWLTVQGKGVKKVVDGLFTFHVFWHLSQLEMCFQFDYPLLATSTM